MENLLNTVLVHYLISYLNLPIKDFLIKITYVPFKIVY